MTRWLDEEEAAVDSSVQDITLTLSSKFLTEVGRVLVLDVFDDWIPAVDV